MEDSEAITGHHLTTTPLLYATTLSCSSEATEGVSSACKHRQVISSDLPWWLNCGRFVLRTKCRSNNIIW